MHYRIEHEFEIDAKSYWDMFFDPAYTKELYGEMKMKSFEVLEQKESGGVLTRVLRATPSTNIPEIFKRVVSDASYVERDRFDRGKGSMEVVVEPQMLKNKMDMRSLYSVVPTGEGRCKRIFEGDVKVSIMIIGGQIEKFMVDELRKNYEIATTVTRRVIAKRKAAQA